MMKCILYTRGKHKDYQWSTNPARPMVAVENESEVCKDYQWSTNPARPCQNYLAGKGVAIYRHEDGMFSVYLFFRSKPGENRDYMTREIAVGCLFTGCNENQAKELALHALARWDDCYADLAQFVHWTDGTEERWEVKQSEIANFIKEIEKKALDNAGTNSVFSDRLENGNTPETRQELMAELARFGFSQNKGVKLVVDSEILTGSVAREISESADRYYMKKGKKKPLPNPSIQEELPAPASTGRGKYVFAILIPILLIASLFGNYWQNATMQKMHKTMAKQKNELKELENWKVQKAKREDEIQKLDNDIAELGKMKGRLDTAIANLTPALEQKKDEVKQAEAAQQQAIQNTAVLNEANRNLTKGIWLQMEHDWLPNANRGVLERLRKVIDQRLPSVQNSQSPHEDRSLLIR